MSTDYERWEPIHWAIESYAFLGQGGFDAIVRNPPFLGGKMVSGAVGTDIRDWLIHVVAKGERGNADLAAYFFLRAYDLVCDHGCLGLIATNTIAQGDTREVGLDQMARRGLTITRAHQSKTWPAASANLQYAAVWGTCGEVSPDVRFEVDGAAVSHISALLEPSGQVGGFPVRLRENEGIAFVGMYALGMGFVVTPEQAHRWIYEDANNSKVLFPFLNGEDLNSRPDFSASRWAIDFNDRSEKSAQRFELPFTHVLANVRPERQRLKPDGSFVLRSPLPMRWWQYADKRPALRRAIEALEEVLAITVVSKSVMPVRVPTGQILSNALCVFATDSFAIQAVLSSSFHFLWVVKYGSGMRNDPRYTSSDVFDTFPRPSDTPGLDRVGKNLDQLRREIMLRRRLGLTALYNLVNDPEVQQDPDVDRVRAVHVEVDEEVLDAYGWADVAFGHGFHTYRQMRRWTVSPDARVEILDRLLELNHERARAEGRDVLVQGELL